jgi:hypothetical protein
VIAWPLEAKKIHDFCEPVGMELAPLLKFLKRPIVFSTRGKQINI